MLTLAAQLPQPAVALAPLDWAVLGAYLAVMLAVGAWLAREKPAGSEAYFVGERSMPVWAVALSILATSLSAATFIGVPGESYAGDLSYLTPNIGALVALTVLAFVFIPAFYRARVTTVYELLEARFGAGGRRAASAAFMVGRLFASGARLFISGVPLAILLSGSLDPRPSAVAWAIVILATAAVLSCIRGGIRSIIWTDVIQTCVYIGAAVAAIVVLLQRIPVPTSDIVSTLARTPVHTGALTSPSKLAVTHFGLDFRQPFTLAAALGGWSLLSLASYGTDQDLVQRMLTCRSAAMGTRSATLGILVGVPVVCLFLAIGLLLSAFYGQPGLMGAAAPGYTPTNDTVFSAFIVREMPAGVRGLMLAGVFAVSLTSLMSALNAMSSTFVTDFYKPIVEGRGGHALLVNPPGVAGPRAGGRGDAHYLFVSRLGVAAWGVGLAAFAILCIWWKAASAESLIQFALSVMTFAYSGLLAVFLTALLTKRGSTASAIAALVVGFVAIALMQPPVWAWVSGMDEAAMAAAKNGSGDWRGVVYTLAFPWRLLAATVVAMGVCCGGRGENAEGTGERRGPQRREEEAR